MYLMGLGERAQNYLYSKGLTTEDAGKVVGSFLLIKYGVLLLTFPFCHRFQPLRSMLRPVQARVRMPRRNWKELARRKISEQQVGWRGKVGNKILGYMDGLAEMAAKKQIWVKTANFLHVDPKQFAMTVAESLVFYKITFLFLGPVTFFALVKLFQHDQTIKAPGDEFLRDFQSDLVDVVVEPEPNLSRWLKRLGKQ